MSSDRSDVCGSATAFPHRHLPYSESPSRSPQHSVAHRPCSSGPWFAEPPCDGPVQAQRRRLSEAAVGVRWNPASTPLGLLFRRNPGRRADPISPATTDRVRRESPDPEATTQSAPSQTFIIPTKAFWTNCRYEGQGATAEVGGQAGWCVDGRGLRPSTHLWLPTSILTCSHRAAMKRGDDRDVARPTAPRVSSCAASPARDFVAAARRFRQGRPTQPRVQAESGPPVRIAP